MGRELGRQRLQMAYHQTVLVHEQAQYRLQS